MIAYVQGVLVEKIPSQVVIETQGIGYAILVPLSLFDKLPPIGAQLKLHTWLHTTDSGSELFGFLEPSDREFFLTLISLSSIGPRSALKMLSRTSPDELRKAIGERSIPKLTAIPGIGKKTAQRIILELGELIDEYVPAGTDEQSRLCQDTVAALLALGYSKAQAKRATNKVLAGMDESTPDLTTLVKEALRYV